MPDYFIHDDWAVVLSRLSSIEPGQYVVYGFSLSILIGNRGSLKVAKAERAVGGVVEDLLRQNRIMCFNVRLGPPVYPFQRIAFVALGIEPRTKLRLESALRRVQFPRLEKMK